MRLASIAALLVLASCAPRSVTTGSSRSETQTMPAPPPPTLTRSVRAASAEALPPSTPFAVVADQPQTGEALDEFRLLIDGALVETKPASALVAGAIRFDHAGILPGSHEFVVIAVKFAPPGHGCLTSGGTPEYCAGKGASAPLLVEVSAAPKFTVGDRVEAWKCGTPVECQQYGDGVAVRSEPSMASPITEVYVPGTQGTITQASILADGFRWWYVDYAPAGADGWSTETNLVKSAEAPPVDCAGEWSAWSAWSSWQPDPPPPGTTEQTRTRSRTFTAEPGTPANGGKPCPPSPEVETETRPVSSQGPTAPRDIACRWTLRAEPPDSSPGWRAQWRQGGISVGKPDPTAPYERMVTVSAPATLKMDVEWSKSGSPPLLSAPRDLSCH